MNVFVNAIIDKFRNPEFLSKNNSEKQNNIIFTPQTNH